MCVYIYIYTCVCVCVFVFVFVFVFVCVCLFVVASEDVRCGYTFQALAGALDGSLQLWDGPRSEQFGSATSA